MSVYNTAKYLEECIESILNQTFTDFEFIISDDGSTDWSKEIIKKYAEKDSRIIFLDNKENRWICANLNDCIKISKWEFIAIMESDDISLPERFEIEIKEFEKDKDLILLWTEWYFIDDISLIKWEYLNSENSNILNLTFLTPWIMFRKNIRDKLDIFSWWYVWDMKLYYDIFFNNLKTKNINKKLIKKRIFNNSTFSNNFLKINKILFQLRLNIIYKYKLKKIFILLSLLDLFINYCVFYCVFMSKKLNLYNVLSPIYRKYILKIYRKYILKINN